jgi:hypothetical protein
LNVALNLQLPVDGIIGKRTLEAEKQLGLENKVSGTNKSEMYRGKLAWQLLPPSEK